MHAAGGDNRLGDDQDQSRRTRRDRSIDLYSLGVPGTALAIGLLWTYVYMPLPIYGTLWILLIAYITRFLPTAYAR
jgi:iron(III) transport system permease protein